MRALVALSLALSAAPVGAQCYQNGGECGQSDQQAAIAALQANQAESFDVTLDASGNGVVTFAPVFAAPPRIAYFPQNSSTTGSQISCNWQTRSATQLTFHCDKSGLLSLLQVPYNPFGNPAAGAMVTIVARGTIAQ